MKYYKLLLSLLLVFVLSFALFSPLTVGAEEIKDFNVAYNWGATNAAWNGYTGSYVTGDNFLLETNESTNRWATDDYIYFDITFSRSDGSILAKGNNKITFSTNNVSPYLFYNANDYPMQKFDSIQIILIHTDGSYTYINDGIEFNYSSGTESHSISLTTNIVKDLQKIKISYRYNPYNRLGIQGLYSSMFFLIHEPVNFTVNIPTAEEKELNEIKETNKGILGKITELWQVSTSGFANIVKSLTDLPSTLWNLISDGLKSLFVPSEAYMMEYKDKWDELLSQRFGAVYQVGTIITDFWNDIQYSEQTGIINIPLVTINLPDNNSFSFGGYDVNVIPVGFEILTFYTRNLISIVCTVLFVNGLKKRYEEVVA